ncbi:MAG: phosphoribosyltransferase [Thioalkalispiraceae bacterium]
MRKRNPTVLTCEIASWNTVTKLSYKLALQIKKDNFQPDIVIAVARGGYVPARLVCDRLDIYDLTSIRITHYTGGSARQEQARLSIPLSIDIKGMQVLLVDDVDDTGDTLNLALEHLNSFQPAVIKSAVLHHKTVASLMPDYYAMTVRKWRWIIYPWALTEDILGFINKMSPQPQSLGETQIRLQQEYGIKLPLKKLRDICSLNE